NYQFRVFEFNGTGCIANYLVPFPAIGNLTTTACTPLAEPTTPSSAPLIVSGLASSIQLAWTRGNGSYCIVVIKAGSSITTPPSDGVSYNANSVYGTGSTTAPGEYVVYSGTGTTVTVTGLLASTTYYFGIYEVNGTGCNSNYLTTPAALISGATSTVASYSLYFGNLHSHSDYSDGDMDNVCNGAGSAYCCYDIGNTALNFDFMGIADHNHNEGPVMTIAKYASGLTEATNYSSTHSDFVALYGMEWGTISTGGHVAVYGINQLVGWNTGNYNTFCAKGDYTTLFSLVASTPNAYTTLCHPNNTDFSNIAGSPYNPVFDNAIVGVAVKNGPYNSLNTSYTDPAAGNNVNYYNTLLSKGYHLGPTVDLDNHNSATMGKSSEGRTVVLATSLSKASIDDAMLNMRYYATEDYNLNASFTVNTQYPMGSVITQISNPVFDVNVSDPDGDVITSIKIWYGVPGSNTPPTVLTSVTNLNALSYTHVFATGTFYYYTEIIEADGNKSWTSPIWYTKIANPLPIQLLAFSGRNISKGNLLEWSTATELNNDYFTLERSRNGSDFEIITTVKGMGTSLTQHDYQYLDKNAPDGINYYRLKQTDFDGHYTYSNTIFIQTEKSNSSFNIYPNPNDGSFYINFPDNGIPTAINVYDAAGRTIRTRIDMLSDFTKITFENISAGIYTLHLLIGQDVVVRKIVVK
ncbi:MAG TPA: T9SS type A sorting domain-containing protein, partial [Bacteroidia bacterium]|nr:T9SS type A sorting domain-containing protein [Bacteroidia bacterium]